MAIHQHATAYELFTGERADVERMTEHFTGLTGLRVLGPPAVAAPATVPTTAG